MKNGQYFSVTMRDGQVRYFKKKCTYIQTFTESESLIGFYTGQGAYGVLLSIINVNDIISIDLHDENATISEDETYIIKNQL